MNHCHRSTLIGPVVFLVPSVSSMTATPDSIPLSSSKPNTLNTSGVQYWNWRGFRMRYRVEGQGTPLILIHGFGASLDHWRNNIPLLSQSYRVYAIDLLGFGKSDKPALDYSLDLWERLLWDFCDQMVKEPAVFVGNSIGALLSLMIIAHKPELSLGGILLNVAGGLNHRPEELNAPLRAIMGTFSRMMALPIIGGLVFNQIRQRSQIRRTLLQVYGNPEAVTDELVEFLYQTELRSRGSESDGVNFVSTSGPQSDGVIAECETSLASPVGRDGSLDPNFCGKAVSGG